MGQALPIILTMELEGLEALNEAIQETPLLCEDASCSGRTSHTSASEASSELSQSSSSTAMPSNRSSLKFVPTDSHLRELAKAGARQFGAKSTTRDYDCIHEEYQDFAQAILGSPAITNKGALLFLTFMAHRPLRSGQMETVEGDSRPKKRRKRYKFSLEDFKSVMEPLRDRTVGAT